jgi:hypothetical protein
VLASVLHEEESCHEKGQASITGRCFGAILCVSVCVCDGHCVLRGRKFEHNIYCTEKLDEHNIML